LDVVERAALEVSNPRHPSYGRYLSPEELSEMTAPDQRDVHTVRSWLAALRGHAKELQQGRRFEVKMPLLEAEGLLHTTFRHVTNTRTGQRAIVAGDYTLPDEVNAAVAAVYGLHGLPLPPHGQVKVASSSHSSTGEADPPEVTPDVIKSQYGITHGMPTAASFGNKQAVAEFGPETYSPKDLKQFFAEFVPNSTAGSDVASKCVGDAACEGMGKPEANLDLQYIMGVAPGVPTEVWYFSGLDVCGSFKEWSSKLVAAGSDAPLVNSVSYGSQGNLTEFGCTPEQIQGVDADLIKLAAAGVTVIFASGDSGSGYQGTTNCSAPQDDVEIEGTVASVQLSSRSIDCCFLAGQQGRGWTFDPPKGSALEGNCTIFAEVTGSKPSKGKVSGVFNGKVQLWPSWPASSPWVTSVGATRFAGQKVGNLEMASDQFGSGGGFSSQFNYSKWQSADVNEYLNIVPKQAPFPPASAFLANGRGTPDVSALGEGYRIFVGGYPRETFGTSASAPVFAAVVSLLNGHQLQNGRPRLGFLNPWLFQNPQMLTDVKEGSNAFGRDTGPLGYGYPCTKGWDPATGLGTPNFPAMLRALPSNQEQVLVT
jgi:tripeptidyl-peptidase-1